MIKIQKIWRGLSKEEKDNILIKHFNLDKRTVDKIRKIPDGKKRLIQAAKVQYELFNHMDSWLWK